MKQIVKTYDGYTFDELSDSAKDNVRQWFADGLDYEWWDCTIDNFVEKMGELGIDIDKEKKYGYQVEFSGFHSQGDGASFVASIDVLKFLREHRLTKEYWMLYLNLKKENCWLSISIDQSYYHKHTMLASLDLDVNWDVISDEKYNKLDKMAEDLAAHVLEICRDYASDLYHDLEKEYDYLLSEECIAESCEVNEYYFSENGRII